MGSCIKQSTIGSCISVTVVTFSKFGCWKFSKLIFSCTFHPSSSYCKNPCELTCVFTVFVVLYLTITTESVYVIVDPVIL